MNAIKLVQANLKNAGLYAGEVDGAWGKMSTAALNKAVDLGTAWDLTKEAYDIAWSGKVSQTFVNRTKEISAKLGVPEPMGPNWFMAAMAFETGETFSPTIKNSAGAPYYGIIQFGAAAAKDAGTSIPALLEMTAEEQLEYVYRFFKPYTGKLKTLSDLYMRILWPVGVGKPEDYALWSLGTKSYEQNKGLDVNKDGIIRKSEANYKVQQKLYSGFQPANRRPLI